MEGKNCFQTRWSQNPLYSGGNIASVYLLPSAASAAADEESQEVTPSSSSSKVGPLCLVTACESTCHLIDAATGNALASFTIPLNDEDVILSIDAVTISQKNRNNNNSSSSIPQEEEAAAATAAESSKKKKSVAKKKETTQTRNHNDDAEEENDDALPNMKETDEDAKFASGAFDGTYIAFSTRQVQIYLLQVVATTSSTTTTTSYTLKLVRNWTASQHAISLVQFAKHGQWLIAGSTDGNVKVWNAFSFFLLHQLHCPHGVITSIALSPRQDRMAVGNFDGWVTLFDMGAKRKIAGKRVHTSAVESILLWARRPTSTTRTGVEEDEFVSVGRDRKIAFVSFDKQSQPQQQTGGGSGLVLVERRAIVVMEFLTCARFEQRDIDDGSFFLHLGAQDGVVATYRVHPTNTVQRICKTDRPKIRSSSSNGADPAAAEGAELDEENAIRCIVLPAQEYRDALFAAHSATGGYDSTHPDALPVMSEGSHPPHDLSKRDSSAISSSSSSSSSLTSTVALFAANSSFNVHYLERHHASSRYTVLTTLVGFLDQILDIKLIPEPTQSLLTLPRLVVTNAKEVLVFQGEGGDGSSALCRARLEGHEDVVMCCAVTPDGRYAATGGKDRRVLVWDLCTYRCVAVGEGTHPSFDPSSSSTKGTRSGNSELGHHGDISNVHFNVRVDAESFFMLVSVGSDESIRFWDVGQSLKAGGVKRGARKQLEGDQDDTSMSSSSAAVSLELSAAVNQAHDGPIHALSVSPNDQYVATGGKDKVVLLWAVRGKKLFKEATLRGHRRGITSLSFSSHDRIVASASNDGTVKVWSLSSLSCVKTLQHDKVGVLTFGFFNKSSQVVTCNLEGVLRVWALASSEVVSTQDIHDSKVWALAIKEAAAPAASSSSSAPSSSLVILTGSSTGTVIATEDITAQEAQRLTEERHEAIYNEQQLQNALRQKNFVDAFTLALKLNHPRHLRQVVARWSVTDAEQCSEQLSQEILPGLQDEQLKRLISYVQDWSSNARHSNVASLVLEAFLNAFHFSESVEKHSFLKDALESLLSYSARHSTRLHSALHRTYLLQYLLRSATAETDERSSADDEQRQQMCDGGVLTREPPQAAIMDTVLGKLLTASPKKRARE